MDVSILDYGARADGTLCTYAIQAAIAACFLAGGGTVEVPKGTFLTGGIRLRSNITLLLRKGACLLGTRNPADYDILRRDTVEPVSAAHMTDGVWTPARTRTSFDFSVKAGSTWNNALIRLLHAENVRIIGEEGSFIDGADCYDENGEEWYRGPHGISMWYASNVHCEGYTVRNSGNWAHNVQRSERRCFERVTVLAGHDGIHMCACDHIKIADCVFYTGDDCVAGVDNAFLTVTRCVMNTACSAFRLGGVHIRISRCKMYGPAKYIFRGSLTKEEKRDGKPTAENEDKHRYNMLSAYTYFSDFSRKARYNPGDIVMEDCEATDVDRFLHYNFSGNELWQRNRPLGDITFRRVKADRIRHPLTAYGDEKERVTVTLEDCDFTIADDKAGMAFMHACHYEQLVMRRVKVSGLQGAPLILRWSDGTIKADNVSYDDAANPFIADADVDFQCRPI